MPESQDDFLTVAKRTGLRVYIALLIVLAVLILGYTYAVFLLAFGGLLLAILLRGIAAPISRRTHLTPVFAVAVVVLLLVAIGGIVAWVVAPQVSTQIDELTDRIPESIARLKGWIAQYGWGQSLMASVSRQYQSMIEQGTVLSKTTSSFYWLAWGVTGIVMVVFIGLYLSVDPDLYRRGFLRAIPARRRGRAAEVLQGVEHVLGRWLLGQSISITIVGVLTGIGLWLLGIPLALTLAIIAALLPNFGPVIAAIPAILLGLLQGPLMALYVALLYLGIQFVESYLVTPLVQRWAVSLPPVLLIVFQVLMGVLAGTLGLIFATPLLAALLVLVEMLYVQDFLGEPVKVAGGSDPRVDKNDEPKAGG
jgi:predicted PurR-regulated permease PerM